MRTFAAFMVAVFAVSTSGCGTLMHPERKGQRGGEVDVGIAILDGLGLLLFIIPGVVAYAVDFSNGTIYLPSGHHRASAVRFDPGADDPAAVVSRETGLSVDTRQAEVVELRSAAEMLARLEEVRDGRFVAP